MTGSVGADEGGVVLSSGGKATVIVTGDVTTERGAGVYVRGAGTFVDYSTGEYAIAVDIDGSVTAGDIGVDAYTTSSGGIDIDIGGDVTTTVDPSALGGDGPQASAPNAGGILAIQTYGGPAQNVDINVVGAITTAAGPGVYARRESSSGSLRIYAGSIDAAGNGVEIATGDNSNANITVGAVNAGGTALQLNATGHSSNFNSIKISGDVTSGSGTDIYDSNGRTDVSLYENASLSGQVMLSSNQDAFTTFGGDISGANVLIDGGVGDYDRFVASGEYSSDGLIEVVGAKVQNFERITIRGAENFVGSVMDGTISAGPSTTVQFAENDTLTAEGDFGGVSVERKGILSSGDDLTINAGGGVTLSGPRILRDYSDYMVGDDPSELPILATQPGGEIFAGGTPGGSTITVNTTQPMAGVTGSGTIDMRNGAVGDAVDVEGQVFLLAPAGSDVLRVDIDPAVAEGDLLTASGDITLAGDIDVNVINITGTGVTDHVVARSTAGVVRSGEDLFGTGPGVSAANADASALTASTDSVAAEVEARIEGQEVIVQVTTDFTPAIEDPDDPEEPADEDVADPDFNDTGLTDNGFAFGEYLNEVLSDPALADVRALALGATNIEELEALYESLGGVELHAPLYSSFQGGAGFGAGLFSCQVGEGQFAAIDEGQCGWTRIAGSTLDRDSSPGDPGVRENKFQIAFGGQFEFDENIRLGGGVGYTNVDSDGDAGLDFEGDRIHAGVVAKYVEGPFMAGVSLTGGLTFGDTERAVGGQTAEGSFDTIDFSAIARVAYLAEVTEQIYVKPQLEGGVTYVDREGFTETGAGAANLQVMSEDEVFAHISPSVEIGGDFAMDDGLKIRPYLRVGAAFVSEDTIDTTARFAASASPATFTTTSARDDIYGTVNAGVAIFSDEDLSLRAEYQGAFSDDTESHGGFLKVQINF